MSDQMADIRAQLEEDEDASMMMAALRGTNMNDDDAAAEGLEMRLIDAGDITGGGVGGDSLKTEYDPKSLAEFFSKRPMTVARRVVQVVSVLGSFIVKVIGDAASGKMDDPDAEVARVIVLRESITSLGPFFIKLGQALSIRPDILSPRSMVELQRLCDKVPSYPSDIAFATIERELGRTVDDLFSEITPEPVAAASLGQVYRAVLADTGDVVAVKVQRPGVLETVSLDLYLARELGGLLRKLPGGISSRLDAVALLDEFAFRFYQELDYNLECENGLKIREQMKVLPMVVIPDNFPKYTSRRVHVAEWVEGEKLSQSKADDVGALVNLGVITYLTQLLDFGFFHADPHPGNMMRTPDGKLAILDFGLMTEVNENQKYGMIEAIAHLINRDYAEIGQDFVNLDFIPEGTDTRPIVPALTNVFDAALAGGGAKSINFQALAADLAQITFEYPFRIPPYFALVIRAISVLEGIALVGNPEFAIIDEAYPYIAKKLMTDRSPRLRAALTYMVYGRDGTFDAERVIDLLQALEKFTAIKDDGDGSAFKVDGKRGGRDVGSAGQFQGTRVVDVSEREADEKYRLTRPDPTKAGPDTDADSSTVREALRFFFSPEGAAFREFLLEEVAGVVDALGRDAVRELAVVAGLDGLPVPSLFRALSPKLSASDRTTVDQLQKLVRFLLGDLEVVAEGSSATSPAEIPKDATRMERARKLFGGGLSAEDARSSERLRALVPVLGEYAPQLREFGAMLVVRLTEKSISRGLNWATDRITAGSGGGAARVANASR